MEDVINILKKVGAITEGHFIGTSGKHLPIYINKDKLISNTRYSSQIGELFAKKFKNKNIEVVVAPAVAGIALSQWTAHHLSRFYKKDVLSIFTEKNLKNEQVLKRGYGNLIKGRQVLIVEDVTTTGSSVKKVIKSVKVAGGKIVACVVILNKDPRLVNSKSIGVPFCALGVLKIPSYSPKNCPLCKKKIPINTSLGHGK